VKQNINLYQPILRKQPKVFSAATMTQISIVIVVVMALLGGVSAWRVNVQERNVAAVEARKSTLRKQIADARAKFEARSSSTLLESELRRLTDEVDNRRKIAALLKKGPLSNTSGFSAHLESLAGNHAAGTWLTQIALREGGGRVNLAGVALAPELVPVYLQRLLGAQAFEGSRFNVLELAVSEQRPEQILFQVGTTQEDRGDEKPAGAG
jgi:hypothetical protein